MAVTIDSFLERYPVFDGIAEEIIEEEIAVASATLVQWTPESFKDKGVRLLVAHTLRLEHGDLILLGASLRAIEEGKEVKLDLVDLSLPYYQQTIYGQQFLNLRKQQTGFSMFVV
jgi:hypothetical protein